MDETVLSKIVNGFRHPSMQVRRRIADLLETDEHWLFERLEHSDHKRQPPAVVDGVAKAAGME